MFKINYQTLAQPKLAINEFAQSVTDPGDEVSKLLNVQMRFPIILGKQTKLLGQFSYENERLMGFYNPKQDADDWAEGFTLHESEFALQLRHELGNLFTLKAQADFASSSTLFFSTNPSSYSYGLSALVEQEQQNRSYGIGLSIRYRSRLTVIPLLYYKKNFGRNWSIDLLLPAKAQVIKDLSKSCRLLMGVRGNTGSYFLDYDQITPNALYQRINVNSFIGYERMLTKYVGFGMDAGLSIPIRSRIRSWEDRTEIIHNFQSTLTPHVSARLFFAISSN